MVIEWLRLDHDRHHTWRGLVRPVSSWRSPIHHHNVIIIAAHLYADRLYLGESNSPRSRSFKTREEQWNKAMYVCCVTTGVKIGHHTYICVVSWVQSFVTVGQLAYRRGNIIKQWSYIHIGFSSLKGYSQHWRQLVLYFAPSMARTQTKLSWFVWRTTVITCWPLPFRIFPELHRGQQGYSVNIQKYVPWLALIKFNLSLGVPRLYK